MTDPPDPGHTRAVLIRDLHALNRGLSRLGVAPLVNGDAMRALDDEHLRAAVKVTGDYLVDIAKKLRGT